MVKKARVMVGKEPCLELELHHVNQERIIFSCCSSFNTLAERLDVPEEFVRQAVGLLAKMLACSFLDTTADQLKVSHAKFVSAVSLVPSDPEVQMRDL